MPTYVYETVPSKKSEKPVEFEVWQQMSDEPLKAHPETGQPVRRVLTSGLAIVSKKGDCCRQSGCGCG